MFTKNLISRTEHLEPSLRNSSFVSLKHNQLWLTRTFPRPITCLTLACRWRPERGTRRHLPASLARWGSGASHHRRCEFSSRNEQQHEFPQETPHCYFGPLCRKMKPIKADLPTQLCDGKLVCSQMHVGWRTVRHMVLSRLYCLALPWKLPKAFIFSNCLECLNMEPENISVVCFLFGEQSSSN